MIMLPWHDHDTLHRCHISSNVLYNLAFLGIPRIACLTPRSASTSSAARFQNQHSKTLTSWSFLTSAQHSIECHRTVVLREPRWDWSLSHWDGLTCSMSRPIPLWVIPRPPNIWTASIAVCWAHRVLYIFKKARGLRVINERWTVCIRHYLPSKLLSLFNIGLNYVLSAPNVSQNSYSYHVAHLVGDALQPILDTFCAGNHLRHLTTNDSQRCQRLSKRLALHDPPAYAVSWRLAKMILPRTSCMLRWVIFGCAHCYSTWPIVHDWNY